MRPEKVQIFKDGQDFTLVIGQDVYFMNDTPNHPQFGVNQYVGDLSDYDQKKFGKRVSLKSVPLEVKKAIEQRIGYG